MSTDDSSETDSLAWRDKAACLGYPLDLFFGDEEERPHRAQIRTDAQTMEAKKVCVRCFVREDCLAWAIREGEDYGVLGGLTESERQRMKRERKRGEDEEAAG